MLTFCKTMHVINFSDCLGIHDTRLALPRCSQCGRAGASVQCHTCDKTLCPGCYRGHGHPLVAGGQGRAIADVLTYGVVLVVCCVGVLAVVVYGVCWILGVGK